MPAWGNAAFQSIAQAPCHQTVPGRLGHFLNYQSVQKFDPIIGADDAIANHLVIFFDAASPQSQTGLGSLCHDRARNVRNWNARIRSNRIGEHYKEDAITEAMVSGIIVYTSRCWKRSQRNSFPRWATAYP